MPHEDLIKPEETLTPVTPVTVVTPVTRVTGDAAPKRDFTRVANSVVRDAVPAGVFSGKGKQLYDFLYTRTRGAIVPKHSARIPTNDVMRGAGMTRHTYRAHLQRLVSTGLVSIEEKPGEHGGNVFTVYLPEEIGINRGHRGDRGHTPVTVQDRDMVQGSDVDTGDRGLSIDNAMTSGDPKTSFKTSERNLDDDAARALIETLRQAERELTGKTSSSSAQWRELAEVLVAELKIAAGRTTISSVPAFMAEHLRRRLWKLDKKQAAREGKELPDQASVKPSIPEGQTCPDCSNTGWWFPDGPEKGVAKCKHANLNVPATPGE
jgi:hypothetical protein